MVQSVSQPQQQQQQQQHNIDIGYIEQMSNNEATILVVDRTVSLGIELKDDSKLTFVEAIGLSTRSDRQSAYFILCIFIRELVESICIVSRDKRVT